ncbi:NlpC/P60 family protein [Enterococcus sp. DIV0756]|uniref:C40 family peptidase n=1 Tax=Enterococcus sp. DIV0756 TaxID=2774636 RepID=UPI003F1F4590
MKKRIMGIVLLLLGCFVPITGYAEPKEETEAAITELQERLLTLNNAISTSLIQQEEQEEEIAVLEKDEAHQEATLKKATEKLDRLEKDIQARLKALQLKEADGKTAVFKLENWSSALKALYSAETVRKADEARGKEYEAQVKTVDQEAKALTKQRMKLEKAQQELADTIKEQEKTKAALEQELTENQALLASLKAEEERQAALRQAEQEALLEELARTPIPRNDRDGDSDTDEEETGEGQSQAQEIILSAKEFLGVPYVWGGTTPQGFDCSGLMQYVFAKHGVSLPRVSQAQQAAAKELSFSELRPGDLVFWGRPAHHVGLYIGDGYFIHAPQPGEVVKVTHVSWFPYQSAGRVLA